MTIGGRGDPVPDDHGDATTDGADEPPAARAQRRSDELAARLARVADDIATSEDQVARTYEESAALRPDAAERLRGEAEDARRFAAHEREQVRRLRGEESDVDGA
jgi:hypothetical protein